MTAIANDFGYDDTFSRMYRALVTPGSLLIAISTSGNSKNITDVVSWALAENTEIITLTGKGGGRLATMASTNLIVPSDDTALIQECHIAVLHYFASIVDQEYHQ